MSNYNNNKTNNKKGGRKPYNNNKKANYKPRTDDYKGNQSSYAYESNSTNDVSWYNRVQPQYTLATPIAFNKIAGVPYEQILGYSFNEGTTVQKTVEAYPTAMRIIYTPGFGKCTVNTDPANIAFSKMYSALATRTSSALPFATHHLAIQVMALQSIAQNLALAKRAIHCSNLWSSMNVAFPSGIMTVAGVDPDSVLQDRNRAASVLDTLINQFNTLETPNFIDVFKRHYALCNNVWTDQDSVYAQMFVFLPSVYYIYSDLGTYEGGAVSGVGAAIPVAFPWYDKPNATINFYDLCDIIREQISAVTNSSDFQNIKGYITKAFNTGDLLRVETIGPFDSKLPVYDEVMMYQIHNMNVVGYPILERKQIPGLEGYHDVAASCIIKGDMVKNIIIHDPHIPTTDVVDMGVMPEHGLLLNYFDSKYVDNNDMNMEATRLMSVWEHRPHQSKSRAYAYALGTEFINSIAIYKMQYNVETGEKELAGDQLPLYLMQTVHVDEFGEETSEWNTALESIVCDLAKFHMAPRIPVLSRLDVFSPDDGGTDTYIPNGMTGDIMFWTNVDNTSLLGLHEVALMSIFDVNGTINTK